MSRSERLLLLWQQLRQRRHPVSAATLAAELGVSVRTLYRDIEVLRCQGADIRGEAGLGLQLRHSSFVLPPLMLDEDEVAAVVLGMRWVLAHADSQLAAAAQSALHKIDASLPPLLSQALHTQALYPVAGSASAEDPTLLAPLRRALQEQRRLHLDYADAKGQHSTRTVWPVLLGYFESVRVLAAWCELRQDFRHFRLDRIRALRLGDAYDVPQAVLHRRWQQQQGVDLQAFQF